MTAYYNEIDTKAAAWLRELIARNLIAPGVVDDRSIEDVKPDDLRGFAQCHFFAGIGVWSYALRNAGWPDSRPVWTGSCPCPPFSVAGKGQKCPDCGSQRNLCHPGKTGHFICLDCGCDRYADGRHLWPEFSRLFKKRRPAVIFGEQVASKDGRYWLDAVSADLQNASYGVAGADICAAGVGAPHIRQRLWFVAERLGDALSEGLEGHGGYGDGSHEPGRIEADTDRSVTTGSSASGMADTEHPGHDRPEAHPPQPSSNRPDSILHDGSGPLVEGQPEPCPTNGYWRDPDWLGCRDGKWRPVRPGSFPLVNGAPARVVRLRGYGNAINAENARIFIEAYKECRQ